jgi:hypothetical protein
MSLTQQRNLPLEISARCSLVTLEFVRNVRGCDAETVLNCVADATHPKCLRWVFNLAVDASDERRRELRFWKDEVLASNVDLAPGIKLSPFAPVDQVINRILGERRNFPRGEIEVQWTIHSSTIARLIRNGELTEVSHYITRDSLAAFLTRRLQ